MADQKYMFISFSREPIIPAAICFTFSSVIDNRMRKQVIQNKEESSKTFCDYYHPCINEVRELQVKFVCLRPKDKTGAFLLFSKSFHDRTHFYDDHNLLLKEHPEANIQRKQREILQISSPVLCSLTSPVENPYNMPPSEIIEKKLFLGGVYSIKPEFLETIHNVVSLVPVVDLPEFTKKYAAKKRHLHIPIQDNLNEEISNYFEEFIIFLNEAFRKEETVYVHCMAGISRSASFVIAYCMENMNIDLHNAQQFVKEKRKIIEPNLNFMGHLQTYGEWLKSGKSLPLKQFREKKFF